MLSVSNAKIIPAYIDLIMTSYQVKNKTILGIVALP